MLGAHSAIAAFAIKTAIADPHGEHFIFEAQKTMYGGKLIAPGDTIFLFASEKAGGHGLLARGIVTSAGPVARRPGVEPQTPRVSISVRRMALAARSLGRADFRGAEELAADGPSAEINFKFYRQATDKIVGLSETAVAFLDRFFEPVG